MANTPQFDLAIIGGGINGCGIAADAAMRGLSVVLIEQGDLASQTSSSSSKLIHGGLRYLEHYDFALVKKALDERQTLLNIAPHLVSPLPFVLPYAQNMRPTWLLRTGLFLYDHLSGKNRLPRSRYLLRRKYPDYFAPLQDNYHKGFLFYDCKTDDARLTLSNALLAKQYGADIRPYTQLVKGDSTTGLWTLTVQTSDKDTQQIIAKALINATGPWVSEVNQRLGLSDHCKISLIKGSHVVVPKQYEGEHAYLLQNIDERIVFLIPFHGNTLIGTTDVPFEGSLQDIHISTEEIDYLLSVANRYVQKPLTPQDILSTWSGVRPLLASEGNKPQELSRDYAYFYQKSPAVNLVVYGGKITTYRQLARQVVDALKPEFTHLTPSISQQTTLPGGDFQARSKDAHANMMAEKYPWLDSQLLQRWLNTYGSQTEKLLDHCQSTTDLGFAFGHGLYQVEVDYLVKNEWARNVNDILFRRTKLGMCFNEREQQQLFEYLKDHSRNP